MEGDADKYQTLPGRTLFDKIFSNAPFKIQHAILNAPLEDKQKLWTIYRKNEPVKSLIQQVANTLKTSPQNVEAAVTAYIFDGIEIYDEEANHCTHHQNKINGAKGGNPRTSWDEIDVFNQIGSAQDVKMNDPVGVKLSLEDEKIEGGLADHWTVEQIAEKHMVSVEHIEEQLQKGIQVEFEHTNDSTIAREIALDHLHKDLDYYDHLEDMEDEFDN